MTDLGVAPERVRVIRNWTHLQPVQQEPAASTRARFGWRDTETVVLHSGNMGAKQGLENVIDAARIADRENLPVRFVLMGDGNQRVQLEEAAQGVQRLQFMRGLPDLEFRSALAAADVLLVNEKPGVNEMAVPSKLTSYFSSGNPVLAATDSTSTTAQEIRASGGGVITESGDPHALLQAALALAADDVSSRRFGEAGRRYCTELLSEEYALDQYEMWVRRLASTKKSAPVRPMSSEGVLV